jgi:hypothetical protein
MQVCAHGDATDEEILHVCNTSNPAGTQHGWLSVIRRPEQGEPRELPVPCDKHKGRYHFLVIC